MRVSTTRFSPAFQQGETFFEVQRGFRIAQRQSQFHHSESYVGLNADYDRSRPAHAQDLFKGAQRADREGVHNVESGDVNDDASRPMLPHHFSQAIPQLNQGRVRQRGLNGGDQKVALFENWDPHGCVSGWYQSEVGSAVWILALERYAVASRSSESEASTCRRPRMSSSYGSAVAEPTRKR